MDPQFPVGELTPKRQLQLQGPRPTPLKVSKDSQKIKKPPHPPPNPAVSIAAAAAATAEQRRRDPVIIYAVSPKVIHAEESNFMSIVQRYTGLSSGNFSGNGNVSPAARLAATEKASLSSREKLGDMGVVGDGGIEEGLIRMPPGILSPAPDALPAFASGTFFSPASEARMMSALNDWSPVLPGSGFMGSPSSTLIPGPFLPSPTLSSDFFAQIWNL